MYHSRSSRPRNNTPRPLPLCPRAQRILRDRLQRQAARVAGEHQSAIGEFYTGAGRELFQGAWPLHVPDTLAAAGMELVYRSPEETSAFWARREDTIRKLMAAK